MNECTAELEARCDWSLSLIGELVNVGRRAGWINGIPFAPSSDDLSACALAAPASDGRSAMQALAESLKLTAHELDLLWLLACVELDPCVARASQFLVFPGMHDMSAQIAERLVGRG